MKDEIIKLLNDWKVNEHKQELMAEELLVLFGVSKRLSLDDYNITYIEKSELASEPKIVTIQAYDKEQAVKLFERVDKNCLILNVNVC